MNESIWQAIRYILIGGGAFLAGRGKIDPTQVPALADQFITVASGLVSAVSAVWGFYIKFRTVSVPAATAARPDVPTISPVTGAVVPTPQGATT